jgi:UDP-GlcNAc3NAcA epimerase
MKIVTIVGARPQFIKSAPVSRALRAAGLSEVVVHTGQHYDAAMSDLFFEELELAQPQHHLGIGSGPHGQQTGRMLGAIEEVLLQERPDWALVYGDTNSTLAGALAAAKLHIPVAHVEAGARSFNRRMPEEINRVTADHLSALLFAASRVAVANLRKEGIAEHAVHFVGDVMFDAQLLFSSLAEHRSQILGRLGLGTKDYALATIHRAENTDDADRMRAIFDGMTDLAGELKVVLPLHPRTRAVLDREIREAFGAAGGILIDPVGYLDMLMLERHAALIVTDSGGVQKEAFFAQVPCITLRDETEWTELVELGWNTLLSPARAHALRECARTARAQKGKSAAPYGDGKAAELVAARLAAAAAGASR